MRVLLTGGAGYIGSHTVRYLEDRGIEVVIVDNLQTGHIETVGDRKFYNIDLRDGTALDRVFKENTIDGVIHFAALSLVGVSMKEPYEYYDNNVYGMLSLLKTMMDNNVKHIVFSSTAATYGEPESIPIFEDSKTDPTPTVPQSSPWNRWCTGLTSPMGCATSPCATSTPQAPSHLVTSAKIIDQKPT